MVGGAGAGVRSTWSNRVGEGATFLGRTDVNVKCCEAAVLSSVFITVWCAQDRHKRARAYVCACS